jgi:hypothetical protein
MSAREIARRIAWIMSETVPKGSAQGGAPEQDAEK